MLKCAMSGSFIRSIRIDHNDSVSILKTLREYESRFGHLIKGGRVEFVSLQSPSMAKSRDRNCPACAVRSGQSAVNTTTRDVHFTRRMRRATVYQRVDLAPGFTATGAALIEEYGSTTLIGPRTVLWSGSSGKSTFSSRRLRAQGGIEHAVTPSAGQKRSDRRRDHS